MEPNMNAPTEKIIADTKVLVADVEELLKATASLTGERVTAARVRLQAALIDAKDTIALNARHVAQATDSYVHEHPWKSVGVTAGAAAGIGLLVGLLIGRR
jgi:ElaB/YqjD/DUF883 family membrane-anchored ribosome-binding protein